MKEWLELAKELLGVGGLIAIGFGWAAFWAWRIRRTDRVHEWENRALLKVLEAYVARSGGYRPFPVNENSGASGGSTKTTGESSTDNGSRERQFWPGSEE